GDITVGENLSLVASRNITASTDANLSANDGARGFNINLVAGADISTAATGSPADAEVTVNGSSATGGSVILDTHGVHIFSRAVSGDNPGGHVTLVAHENGGSGGQVLLSPTSVIDSSGSGTGSNGNVAIIAGAASGTSVSTGAIKTDGGSGGGGNVSIS